MPNKGMKLTKPEHNGASQPRCWVDNGTRKNQNGDRDTRETAGRGYDETRRSP